MSFPLSNLISVIPLQVYLNKKNHWERNKTSGPYQIFFDFSSNAFQIGFFCNCLSIYFCFFAFLVKVQSFGSASIHRDFFFPTDTYYFIPSNCYIQFFHIFTYLEPFFWSKKLLLGKNYIVWNFYISLYAKKQYITSCVSQV